MVKSFLFTFCWSLRESLKVGFTNGVGRQAMFFFLHFAVMACELHLQGPSKIQCLVQNAGGSGKLNQASVGTAIRKVADCSAPYKEFEYRDSVLRNPREWELPPDFPSEDENSEWRYKLHIPDVVLEVANDLTLEKLGGLVLEVKSKSTSSREAQLQAFTQALKFLKYEPRIAAMAVHPEVITFIGATVENGRLVTKKKNYALLSSSHPHVEVDDLWVNQHQFKELFKDVVLYLWNTYYVSEEAVTV